MTSQKQNALRQEGARNTYRGPDYRNALAGNTSPVEVLLSRLNKVRRTGAGRWIACCPAHRDRSPSLAVRELDDGRVLLHCFSGNCDVQNIVAAVGLELSDLYPPRPLGEHFKKGERRPFVSHDALRAMAFEANVIVFAGSALADGTLTETDRQRTVQAVSRFHAGLAAAGVVL